MKKLASEIERVKADIIAPKPELSVSTGAYHSLRIKAADMPIYGESINSLDEPVAEMIKEFTRLKLNIDTKCYKVVLDVDEVIGRVLVISINTIIHFLRHNGGFANNRLSKVYKWYREEVTTERLRQDDAFASDIYGVSKFINSKTTEEHFKTVRILLGLLKDRYEPKYHK